MDPAEQRREERRRISEQKKLAQSKFGGKLESEETNPCLKEHILTNQCLKDNNYKEEACSAYFDNYKACKLFWWTLAVQRRRSGIQPELPPPEEREKFRAEHMKKAQGN